MHTSKPVATTLGCVSCRCHLFSPLVCLHSQEEKQRSTHNSITSKTTTTRQTHPSQSKWTHNRWQQESHTRQTETKRYQTYMSKKLTKHTNVLLNWIFGCYMYNMNVLLLFFSATQPTLIDIFKPRDPRSPAGAHHCIDIMHQGLVKEVLHGNMDKVWCGSRPSSIHMCCRWQLRSHFSPHANCYLHTSFQLLS